MASFPYKTAVSETNVKTNRKVAQNGPITENRVLPVTTLFFESFVSGYGSLISNWFCVRTRRGVVVITTAQLHSSKPEPTFCTSSNPARGCERFAKVRISDNGPGWK